MKVQTCVRCIIHSYASLFQCCEHFPGCKEGTKWRLTFFTRFTVVEVIWLYLKIQQAICNPDLQIHNWQYLLPFGISKSRHRYEKLGLDNEFKGDTCWMWNFQVSNKAVATRESGHSREEITDTCKQLQLRHICCSQCSCIAGSFGGIFVSLHVANRVSGPALRGRLSSKLVLNIKL